jgi:hypothetical protein
LLPGMPKEWNPLAYAQGSNRGERFRDAARKRRAAGLARRPAAAWKSTAGNFHSGNTGTRRRSVSSARQPHTLHLTMPTPSNGGGDARLRYVDRHGPIDAHGKHLPITAERPSVGERAGAATQ